MPAVIGRPPRPAPFVRVPTRLGLALEPELDRRVIPARVTLDANAPPFAGELREDQHGPKVTSPPGSTVVLATLRRAWNYVGFAFEPGDYGGQVGFALTLRVMTRSINGIVLNQGLPATPSAGVNTAFVGFVVGAACELVALNNSELTFHNLRGSIWGMGEK
jgi:hypothetical protein